VTHLKQKETEDHEVAGIRSLTWKTTMNCCKYGSESETQNAYRSQLSKRRNLFVPSQIRFTSSSFRIHKRARKRERERERSNLSAWGDDKGEWDEIAEAGMTLFRSLTFSIAHGTNRVPFVIVNVIDSVCIFLLYFLFLWFWFSPSWLVT